MNEKGCGFIFVLVLLIALFSSGGGENTEVNDILAAKQYVLQQLNYPDTADFHDMKTSVTSTHIHLTVTAKNGFGVPTTLSFSVPRDKLTDSR